jgi:hypothetical protein
MFTDVSHCQPLSADVGSAAYFDLRQGYGETSRTA